MALSSKGLRDYIFQVMSPHHCSIITYHDELLFTIGLPASQQRNDFMGIQRTSPLHETKKSRKAAERTDQYSHPNIPGNK
jgi:hypothetical protein